MASVAEIDGLTVPTGVPVVSTPAAAYSVRLLDSALGVPTYTGAAMRVRRETAGGAGDDDEADIAFDTSLTDPTISLDSAISNASAGVTATTLGQFLNVGTVNGTTYTNPDSLTVTASCLTDTWYDQSGNANHAEQTAQGSQPQIHSGTVNTDLNTENGKPFLKFRGGNGGNESLSMTSQVSCETIFSVLANDTAGFLAYYLFTTGANLGFYSGGTFQVSVNGPGVLATNTLGSISGTVTGQTLLYNDHNGTGWEVGQDGGTASQVIATSNKAIDQIVRPSTNLQVEKFQECIIWDSDQSSNRTAIEENINSNYLIYQPTDQPTSGLLYDYGSATGGTDAAAAYSVRQLSDKAVICMRIRRDMGVGNPGDDDEINIGFDANGDLDTQAISDFCGTGTGYVTRWWDQSVNGNHADQPVGGTGSNGFQPQIYNGTAVIEENGKPALDFDGSNDSLDVSVSISASNYALFYVNKRTTPLNGWVLDTTTGRMVLDSYPNGLYFDGGFQGTAISSTAQNLQFISLVSPSSGSLYTNGTQAQSGISYTQTAFGGTTIIGRSISGQGSAQYRGLIQEMILYAADQSSNRAGIESDIMTHFNIP